MAKLTQKEAKKRAKSVGGELIGKYDGCNTKTEFKCPQCNETFFRRLDDVVRKNLIYCRNCGKKRRTNLMITQEEAEKRAKDVGCELIGKYKGKDTKTEFKCPKCNQIFIRAPHSVCNAKLIYCRTCGKHKKNTLKRLAGATSRTITLSNWGKGPTRSSKHVK